MMDINLLLKNEGYIKDESIYGTKDLRFLWLEINSKLKNRN